MRMRDLVVSFTILAALLLSSSLAFAQVIPFQGSDSLQSFPQENVKKVTFLLSGFHEIGTKAQFSKVANAEGILISLAKSEESFVRDRALIGLARYFASADLYLLMASVISKPETSFGTRLRVMVQFGETFGSRALPILKHYLKDADLQVRIGALQSLQATNADEAFLLIADHAKTEKSSLVLEAVKKYSEHTR